MCCHKSCKSCNRNLRKPLMTKQVWNMSSIVVTNYNKNSGCIREWAVPIHSVMQWYASEHKSLLFFCNCVWLNIKIFCFFYRNLFSLQEVHWKAPECHQVNILHLHLWKGNKKLVMCAQIDLVTVYWWSITVFSCM